MIQTGVVRMVTDTADRVHVHAQQTGDTEWRAYLQGVEDVLRFMSGQTGATEALARAMREDD